MTDTSKIRTTPESDQVISGVRVDGTSGERRDFIILCRKLERQRDELAEGILTLRYSILADSSLMVLTYDLDKLIALARKCK